MNAFNMIIALLIISILLLEIAQIIFRNKKANFYKNRNTEKDGKSTIPMSPGMLAVLPIVFVWVIIFSNVEWIKFHFYYKPLYALFGKLFYFPFWFYEFNDFGLTVSFLFTILFCWIYKCVKVRFVLMGILLSIAFAPILTALISNYQDIKNVLHNNYIVTTVPAYAPDYHSGRGNYHYYLPIDGNYYNSYWNKGNATIDLMTYKKLCAFQVKMRKQFMAQNNLTKKDLSTGGGTDNIEDMSDHDFWSSINSEEGDKWREFQKSHKIKI